MNDQIINLVNQKLTAMDIADDQLLKKVRETEDLILKKVLALLDKLSTKGGKFDKSDKVNQKILQSLNRRLIEVINKSTFQSDVAPYLKVFDDVENISKKIIELQNNISLKDFNLSQEKKDAIEEIATGILNETLLKANLVNPIKKILYRHVTTGVSYKDARQELIQFIKNDPNRAGFAEKYVRQITQEALSRYDGMINQRVATEFGLDAFSIVGSLIRTSAEVCIHMINESGPFKGMAVNGKYATADIDKIVNIISRYPGFVKGTNAGNYFVNRNHWGCRHTFIPTRFLKRDKDAIKEGVVSKTMPDQDNDIVFEPVDN